MKRMQQGRGGRHRHQLDPAAGRRRRRRAGEEVERRSRVTRLGRGVDLTGRLSAEAIEAACEAIGDYVAIYQEAGVEAVRRSRPARCATPPTGAPSSPSCGSASRSRRACSTARRRRGSPISGRPGAPAAAADPGGRHRRRLDRADHRHGGGDLLPRLPTGRRRPPHRAPHRLRPPTAAELEALAADARGLIEAAIAGPTRPRPRRDRRGRHADLAGRDRAGAGALRPRAGPRPRALPRPRSSGCSRGWPRRRWRSGSRCRAAPDRAPTIVAGVVILIETMRAFGLDRDRRFPSTTSSTERLSRPLGECRRETR